MATLEYTRKERKVRGKAKAYTYVYADGKKVGEIYRDIPLRAVVLFDIARKNRRYFFDVPSAKEVAHEKWG